eukprot:CAMPEP_0201523910 /NCGR_PEP_ID=MMETSP0161_2-20130828/20998_1 /ASSEMBLY_ACC=CAM_ASM_000251 /TAXON_ID=180227 /ORGANISM="Neoparamoeba aestuarina, Strain SoJaBio B1-5/56/2" /LENGTH=314 /DNA_ID=CAMNT_0047923143 /DNA_START=70 /DNA_END=1014 /DNA_ORIENTATION=-
MPAKNSKMLKSTQLVYVDDKPQSFHKLDDEIVKESPLLSKKEKRKSRLARMSQLGSPRRMSHIGSPTRFSKKDTGDENAAQENVALPILPRKGSLGFNKAKEEQKQEKDQKQEDNEKKMEREKSMNWADMEDIADVPSFQKSSTFSDSGSRRPRHARLRTLQPSHPDISSKFKYFYTSPECKACEKMTEFCQQVPPPVETRDAETEPLKLAEALTFARKHKEILVMDKGGCEKIVLNSQFDPPSATLEKKILNKEGRMKTPMAVIGHSMVIGYNEDVMRESLFFGNKSPTSFKRKRKNSITRPLSTMKRSKNNE